MNVLQINAECGIGSIGRMVTAMHALLTSRGHRSTVAFGRFDAVNCSRAVRIGNRLDLYRHVARTRLFDDHGFGSVAATEALLDKLKAVDPDVIHLHNAHGYYLNIGVLFDYLKRAGKRVIWTLHDCWAFTGHCSYFDLAGCDRWRSGCHHCPLKREYPSSLWLDGSPRNYGRKRQLFTNIPDLTLVTPSQWLAGLARASFLREYPVALINTGIDLTVFQPTPGDFRNRWKLQDQFILLGVAFRWERKGFPYFMALARQLRPDEKLVLVGVPRRQIKKLPPGVIGIPRTDSATELAGIYSAADVFVNPTLEEVLGMVNIEALACGTPVVTFNSGGSPECLDAECGLVVKRGDLAGLAAAIATIRKHGKGFYSANCRKRAQDCFDQEIQLAKYVELYQGLYRRLPMASDPQSQTSGVGQLRLP